MSLIQRLSENIARNAFYDIVLEACLSDLVPFEGDDENGRFFLFNEQTAFDMVIDQITDRFAVADDDRLEFDGCLFNAISDQTWDALREEVLCHIKDQNAYHSNPLKYHGFNQRDFA